MNARLRKNLERAGLVALGVACDTAAMPPGPAPALAFVADVPFLWLLWHRGGERWKRWAFLYGFVRFAVGLRWLAEVHWAQVIGAPAILALTYLAWGGAIRFLSRRGVPFPLAVAVTAVLQEMAQTVVVVHSGMPWPNRSLAFVAWPSLLGAACEMGAYGLSFLAVLTSAWASGLPAAIRPSPWRREHARRLVAAGVPILLLLGAAVGRGAIRVASVDARLESHEAFRTQDLVIVQANVPQALKHAPREHDKLFKRHVDLSREALDWFVDHRQVPVAVLWPETMVPYPFMDPALVNERTPPEIVEDWHSEWNVIGHLRAAASPPNLPVRFLIGVNHYFKGRSGDHEHLLEYDSLDSLLYVDPSAQVEVPEAPDANDRAWHPAWSIARHDKVVLVPWGEYTPAGDLLPFLRHGRDLVSEIPEITPGEWDQEPFHLAEGPPSQPGRANRPVLAGTVICFELAFPARCRAWRRAGATVLLNAGNYGWFGDTGMPHQVTAMARLRAVELGMTVAIAGNTGPSSIIDPAGRTLAEVEVNGRKHFEEGWCHGPLVCDPGYTTTYAMLGDWPWLILGTLLFGWAIFFGRKPVPAVPDGAPVPDETGSQGSPARPAGSPIDPTGPPPAS